MASETEPKTYRATLRGDGFVYVKNNAWGPLVNARRWSDRLLAPELSLAVIWWVMAFFAAQASYEGLTYILGDFRGFDPLFRDKYVSHIVLVRTHGLAGASALCLGLVTFLPWTRRHKLHAWMGRLYGAAVVLAAGTALPMALMAEGGRTTRLAFFLQASFWLGTMLLAVAAARHKRFLRHRRFMVRNYALTYSAVASRLLLNGLQETGLSFSEVYPVISWTWLIGLAVGEWWLWYSPVVLEHRNTRSSSSRRIGKG